MNNINMLFEKLFTELLKDKKYFNNFWSLENINTAIENRVNELIDTGHIEEAENVFNAREYVFKHYETKQD